MIIESVLITKNKDNTPHFAAAGVEYSLDIISFYLYKKSKTAENLLNKKEGVVNISDKALHIVKSALSASDFSIKRTENINSYYLADSCSYSEFICRDIKEKNDKYIIEAEVISKNNIRDYNGFNRANNLLVETAVKVSRINIKYTKSEVEKFLDENRRVIFKTASADGIKCYYFLKDYLKNLGG